MQSIQGANFSDIQAVNSKALVQRAQTVALHETQEAAPASDSVDLKEKSSSRKSSSRSKGSSKSSSSQRSKSTRSTRETSTPQLSRFEKASEKFLKSLMTLQGCSEQDSEFIQNAFLATQQMTDLTSVQKQFVLAQGAGRYAITELSKLAESADTPEHASAQTKRWDALTQVIKAANAMVKASPAEATPPVADFASGTPGSNLLNSQPTPPSDPTQPAPPSDPQPPAEPPPDPAMEDYKNATKIYQEIWAARQKNMQDLLKIQQDTQTEINASMQRIWQGWADKYKAGIDLFTRYLNWNGDPRAW